jgi:DNA-binding transcriptional regulator YiaG
MTRSQTAAADLALDDQADPGHARSARALVQGVRWRSGLSQDEFARAFCIPARQLAALELGEARPDPALTAYLRVIDHAPDVVREALDRP